MEKPEKPAVELTIITVVIEKHYEYIERQISLIDSLNPDASWQLLVVDNAAGQFPNFQSNDPRVKVMTGINADESLPENFRGSYHHAGALNKAIKIVNSRFVLILDPDLFVVYRGWIEEVARHIEIHGQTFFGVPWHYRWYKKFRYFPCTHFLFVDLSKIRVDEIDFTPGITDHRPVGALERLFKAWPVVSIRWHIGSSRDTGWKLWRDFGRTGRHAAGVVSPVVDIRRQIPKPKFLKNEFGRWRERLLPRSLRLLPAPGTYLEPTQAPGFSSAAFAALEPENFVWRGAPFAFHLRRHVRDTVRRDSDQSAEGLILTPLLRDVQSKRLWISWAYGDIQSPRGSSDAG